MLLAAVRPHGLEFFDVSFLGWTRRFGMNASRFTDAQKAFAVKQDEEGTPVAENRSVQRQAAH